ncbi:hypothetical protein SARC_13506 [Sphaeroforma arctica JP610]|uniref:SURP motif domain-containing protein n=1 Tax=Sphaeroforma arctica JP610 TaxID=667725 RepID=A0A0L0FAZ4_9EUKA|nr:hypothetical protein SARC_13506 [Sphaeroforma arctica JP610]KNC73935.1 hypothetical protein SARC_13506 [Sphaeroforma arctica JP610]|eukprot:XP_014147837.1 hypothetical protein SARC_13506 [Sphaeroforma arctica JP610]
MQTSKKKDIIAFTEPPPELEFSVTVPTISAQDIAIVKLTAQFVAKNGKGFLQSLMQREVRNYHFDFLKPHHSLFFYFTKLVEQYTKVMLPPKGTKEVLQKDGKSPYNALGRVEHRLNWKKQENAKKEAANKDVENERKAFLSINWADFVVVETVPFAEDDTSELPPPVNRQTIAQRILDQERLQTKKKAPAAELVPEAEAENEGENAEENEADVEEVEMEMEDGTRAWIVMCVF